MTVDASPLALHLREARVAALLGRPVESSLSATLAPEIAVLVEQTAAAFALSIGDETRATYAHRWELWENWCNERGFRPLPAAPEAVMLYLSETAHDGRALGTLRGWMAALNRVHLEAGFTPPGDDPGMGMYMRGLSRMTDRPRSLNVNALRIAQLRQVCEVLVQQEHPPQDIRDRAVLVLSRANLSDGAISRLDWADLRVGRSTATVVVRSTRVDGKDRRVVLRARKDKRDCPVDAIAQWRALAEDDQPFVFTAIDAYGHRAKRRLVPKSVYSIRKSRLASLSPTHDLNSAILALGTRSRAATRDRALVLLGFSGAFRRVDLIRLQWRDIEITPRGAIVHLRRSKTDREGHGSDVGIPMGRSPLTCPVTALKAWRDAYGTAGALTPDAPVFVRVGRSGRLDEKPLTGEAVTDIVKRRARQADLGGKWGGRSLRAGFISTAADLDIPLELIARQSRHATLDTLMRYIRTDDPLRRNPANNVGL